MKKVSLLLTIIIYSYLAPVFAESIIIPNEDTLLPPSLELILIPTDDVNKNETKSYLDFRNISSHRDNNNLRRMDIIDNLLKPIAFGKDDSIVISSIKKTIVFNCLSDEIAFMDSVMYSDYWAEGEAIFQYDKVGQWQALKKPSFLSFVGKDVCRIKPERLKKEPKPVKVMKL